MTKDDYWRAFFVLHDDLTRQGPGTPEDVAWALSEAQVPIGAHILDAGCGAGADIPALLAHPGAVVTAVDPHGPFIDTVRANFAGKPVTAEAVSMADAPGPYDFIWCQGALYFLGITEGLGILADKLAPGAAIAFSEPVWLTPTPSARSQRLWHDYPALTDITGLDARIIASGLTLKARRHLAPAAWDAYYTPMEQRIAALRPGADETLSQVLDAATEEAGTWRAHPGDYTYVLNIVVP